eukprot:4836679-Amphidinium_carterae.1
MKSNVCIVKKSRESVCNNSVIDVSSKNLGVSRCRFWFPDKDGFTSKSKTIASELHDLNVIARQFSIVLGQTRLRPFNAFVQRMVRRTVVRSPYRLVVVPSLSLQDLMAALSYTHYKHSLTFKDLLTNANNNVPTRSHNYDTGSLNNYLYKSTWAAVFSTRHAHSFDMEFDGVACSRGSVGVRHALRGVGSALFFPSSERTWVMLTPTRGSSCGRRRSCFWAVLSRS